MRFYTPKVLLIVLSVFSIALQATSNSKLLKEAKRGHKNVIKLTDSNFRNILNPTRDSYILVYLTASQDDIGCTLCKTLDPEVDILAESWFKTHPDGINDKEESEKGLFFAKADYSDGGNTLVFQHFKASQVPLMYVFGPTDDPNAGINVFQQLNIPGNVAPGDQRIEMLINSFTHYFELKDYKLYKPVDYASKAITLAISIAILVLMRVYKNVVKAVITSKILWATISTSFITIMCNGYMFNKIRGSPYVGSNNNGVEYIQSGMQSQYAIETQIVSFVYGVLALSVLLLIKAVPFINSYYQKKGKDYNAATFSLLLTVIFLALIFFFSSALMYIFRQKYSPYPFKFLK